MQDREQKQEFSFIKEKIKNKPINKRRIVCKLLWVIFCGIIFGFIAGLTFVIAVPKLEKLVEPQPNAMVTIPKDQQEENPESGHQGQSGESQGQTGGSQGQSGENQGQTGENQGQTGENQGQNDESQESGAKEETPVVPEPVYIEQELETTDYQSLYHKLYAIGKKASRSMVTVTGVTSNTDWFDSAYERENQDSGIIIANNGQELLILTERKVIVNAEEISITFMNGDVVPAALKKYDANTGIAIISVNLEDITQETMDKIEVAVLGNSFAVKQGTVVLAIGSPLGYHDSILTGTITTSKNTVSTWDSTYTIFTTDIMGNAEGSGVLINLAGEVVGLVMQDYSSVGEQNTLTALAISQLKGIIEDLSNGKAIPYLGMKLSTVTDEIAQEYGIPNGVYVKSVETDVPSPAMNAGLLEADVIVAMNGEAIMTVEEYTQMLLTLSPEQSVKIKVLRQSGESYVEMEITATVGVLQ